MINSSTKLSIFLNSTDHSDDLFDFTRDQVSISFGTSDFIYIGFYKPINFFYIDLADANVNNTTLQATIWDGTNWVSVSLEDKTKGFKRSGYVSFNDSIKDSMKSKTINTKDLFWIRLATSSAMSPVLINGLNVIFADDQELIVEQPEIKSEDFLNGKQSHILTHIAVRNQIIEDLNSKLSPKFDQVSGQQVELTAWDLLDITQLRQSAINLALSKIYFNLSDKPDDKFYQLSQDYNSRYQKSIQLSFLAIDRNDDGLKSTFESAPSDSLTNFRLVR